MRSKINLNYNWFFKELQEDKDLKLNNYDGFSEVRLPHTQKEIPYNYFDWDKQQIVSSYKRALNVKKDPNKSYILSFLGIAQRSEIYLNGKLLKENKCGYNQIDLDITGELKDGDNELYVLVSSKEESFPPFGNVVDYLGYGGIYREVYLYETGSDYLINPFLYTENLLTEDRKFNFEVSFKHSKESKVRLLVTDNKENLINTTFTAKYGEKYSEKLPKVNLWNVNNPYLYSVKVELLNDKDEVLDDLSFDYGFREVKGDRYGFYLNGEKLLIRGLDRHQAWPYVGYAMPVSMQKRDADILKFKLGSNCMRCSHYMNHPEFLNECDKIGLLVYEEFPGWQYVGGEEWKAQALSNLDSMILRDRNHPSIAFFGVRINESKEDLPFNTKCYKRAKELDPSRIITGTHNNMKERDKYDCYSYNNFFVELTPKLLFKKSEVTKKSNPYMITEYCGHMHPNKPYDTEERRVDTSIIHKKVISKVSKEGDLFGAMGWVFADYNTHKGFGPNDMICYHGVLDMNRCEKATSYVYQALRGKDRPFLECSSALAPGDYDASVFKAPVVYTNCDKVEVYRGEELLKTYEIGDDVDSRVFYFADFIGNDLVKDHNESKKFQESFKKTLRYVCINGMDNKLGLFFHSNIFKAKKIIEYGTEYLGNITKYVYTFKGYIDNKEVAEKKIGYASFDHLDYSLSNESLNIIDTYDIISLTITAKDTLGNIPRFLPDVVSINYSDGLELIGPDKLSLIGGNATFYFKNKYQKASNEKVTINMDRVDSFDVNIKVNI